MRSHPAVLAVCCSLLLHTERATAIEVPPLRAHVNDYAGLLAADRAAALEARLTTYEAGTQHQLALLTVPSLDGADIESFAIRVAEQWKLGGKAEDDGLVLVVARAERKMRIEVGYGLEGDVPDAVAARIVRDVLTPAFRTGDFAGGIDAAFTALMQAAGGPVPSAVAPQTPQTQRKPSPRGLLGPLLLPLLIFLFFSLLGRRRMGPGGAFLLGAALSGMGRRGGRSGGGGLGGGRGGGFGGGGASGGW